MTHITLLRDIRYVIVSLRHSVLLGGTATLVLRLRSTGYGAGRAKITLKITVHHEPEAITLEVEGRVAGPWVKEFDRSWQSVAASLGSKKFWVDLRGVTHMSAEGRQILAEIRNKTGADFLADTPMTKYFVEEARNKNKRGTKEEA